ncbi:MAG: pitrilysin family protein [Alphaproteobacteria bacterium]
MWRIRLILRNALFALGSTTTLAFAQPMFQTDALDLAKPIRQTLASEISVAPTLDSFTLDNGLRIVAVPIANATNATLMVWYGAGSADDPPDLPGLAHYTEHATFRALGTHEPEGGSPAKPAAPYVNAQPEAFTSFDYTAYYHILPNQQLDPALELEAARLSTLTIDDAAVEAERDEVLGERMHDIDREPLVSLEEEVQAAMFAGTPYQSPIIAEDFVTKQTSAADVNAFLDTWYAPNNAILVVAGAVDPSGLRQKVERYFAPISPRDVPKRERPSPSSSDVISLALEYESSHPRLWARTSLAPSFATAGGHEAVALQILAIVLADGDFGPLHTKLIDELGVARELSIEYDPNAITDTTFTIHAVLPNDDDSSAFEKALESELAKLTTLAVSTTEVIRARDHALSELAAAWRDPYEAANLVGTTLATGQSLKDLASLPEKISAVGPEDIRRAAHLVVTASRRVTAMTRAYVD